MGAGTGRDFASLLDELLVEARMEDHGVPRPAVSFDYLAVAEELLSGRIKVADDKVVSEYSATSGSSDERVDALFEAAASSIESADLPPVEPEAILRELGLKASSNAAELARIRRAFAFKNHPDRVAPHLRQRAMVRMQVANMLIDDARRRAGRKPR
ncbi:hypothetical protein [Mesorhizobium sp. 1B3]|uniref:hypothetical protein n=1 Tax=Mesorhizobium sp. 1B3 TaxID=3243599 RepID=UPI003D984081